MIKKTLSFTLGLILLLTSNCSFAQTSTLVSLDSSGKLAYKADAKGNTVPDFSGVGYKNGEVAIPTVAVVKTVYPVAGDNLATIQNAINEVAKLPIGADGFRGAILFKKGFYPVSDTIKISASGIVLRGEGTDTTKGTRFHATSLKQYALFSFVGTGGISNTGSKKYTTDAYIPYGSNQLTVSSNNSNFKVGDSILIQRVPDSNWINLLTMAQWGWVSTSYVVSYQRKITAVNGNFLTFDAPMVDIIDTSYAKCLVTKYKSTRMQQCGLENMCLSSVYTSDTAENHAWDAVDFDNAQNCWVRNVDAYYFGYSNVMMYSGASWITVDSCKMIDPKSQITGERRYSFNISGQHCLVKNCFTRNGRHDFVTGSRNPGPNVFYNSKATKQQADIGPHQRWATGTLYDNIVSNGSQNVQNRESYGSGHGWAGAQIMFWNCTAKDMILQDPEGDATNWAIGCTANITNVGGLTTEPYGIVESKNKPIAAIPSLYVAQLNQRLNIGNKKAQNISFDTLETKALGDTDFMPICNASSKLPITFTSMNPFVATIVNGKIHIVGIGTAIINASQKGDTTFTAAPVYGQLLTVVKSLPIQLKNISATLKSNTVLINWTVSNPSSIKQFIIERSNNGNSFSAIGSVSSINKNSFSFTDLSPINTAYYRIKMVGVDGSITYSNSLLVEKETNKGISIYPNPINSHLSIAGLGGKSNLKITNTEGKKVFEQSTTANNLTISLSGLKAGVYFLSATDELGSIKTKRFIKE